jgi:hypothetical protein
MIDAFDLNLTFNHNMSTSPYQPWSITEYNNQMYVGTTNGLVLVIQNERILNQFNGCGGNSATVDSILFDDYGYIVTSCDNPFNILHLYFVNRTFTGQSITTPTSPLFILELIPNHV